MATIPLDLDGYTDLPSGHIANFVTYLEMAPPQSSPEPAGSPYRVRKVEAPALSWYRAIYRRVGDRWLWVGRAMMEDAVLAAWLTAPTTELLALEKGDETMGFAELDWRVAGNLEIAMFGVVPEATGKGAAAQLMGRRRREGGRRESSASGSTPAPSTTRRRFPSIGAPASGPINSRSRLCRIRASQANCRARQARTFRWSIRSDSGLDLWANHSSRHSGESRNPCVG
jgi:hypothetical protein